MYINHPFNVLYKNTALNINYRKSYKHRYTKDPKYTVLSNTLDGVLPFVKIILEYIEGVYFIGSGSVESAMVPEIITREFPSNHVNFLLTTDRYEYQYANKGFYVIRPKQEDSYIVTKNNLISTLKMEERVTTDIDVGVNFTSFILSLLGDRNRDIGKIKKVGLSGILKMLDKGISDNLISKDVSNINILSSIIKPEFQPLVLSNYYAIDIDTQYSMLNARDIYDITSHIVDKFDNVALKEINDRYFIQSPLYLIELTQASSLLKPKVPKKINWT